MKMKIKIIIGSQIFCCQHTMLTIHRLCFDADTFSQWFCENLIQNISNDTSKSHAHKKHHWIKQNAMSISDNETRVFVVWGEDFLVKIFKYETQTIQVNQNLTMVVWPIDSLKHDPWRLIAINFWINHRLQSHCDDFEYYLI